MDQRTRNLTFKVNMKFLLRVLILHFLSFRNYYGEELRDLICKSLDDKYRPSNGTLYPILREMEENLLIEGYWTEPNVKSTKIYKITDTGVNYLKRMKPVLVEYVRDSIMMLNCVLSDLTK